MKKHLLVIENHFEINNLIVKAYMRRWEGDMTIFTNFRSKTDEEIYAAIKKATHIIAASQFVNGSEGQFYKMAVLLSTFPEPKTIIVDYKEVDEDKPGDKPFAAYVKSNLPNSKIYAIRHHKVFDIGYDWSGEIKKGGEEPLQFYPADFSKQIRTEQKRLSTIALREKKKAEFMASAQSRPTGRKIKILNVVAFGSAFSTLKFGDVVDEVDMKQKGYGIQKAWNKNRGVWVWGNGEPVKLLNEGNYNEYEIVSTINSIGDLFAEIASFEPSFQPSRLKRSQIVGLDVILSNDEVSELEKANFLCEEINIPKRHNRSKIQTLLSKYKA